MAIAWYVLLKGFHYSLTGQVPCAFVQCSPERGGAGPTIFLVTLCDPDLPIFMHEVVDEVANAYLSHGTIACANFTRQSAPEVYKPRAAMRIRSVRALSGTAHYKLYELYVCANFKRQCPIKVVRTWDGSPIRSCTNFTWQSALKLYDLYVAMRIKSCTNFIDCVNLRRGSAKICTSTPGQC